LAGRDPLLNCRRHPRKNIRWRYLERFPYRVIYQVSEDDQLVVVAAVLHAARHDRGNLDHVGSIGIDCEGLGG